jgi:hypothetical protein
MDDELNKTGEALKSFILDYWQNSFDYFYEEDIRAGLHAKLKAYIKTIGVYQFDSQFDSLKNYFKSKAFESSIIKAEYPYSNNSRKRFDLVLLENSGVNFYKIPASVGIEIKIASEETFVNNVSGYIENIISLDDYRKSNSDFSGIALYFYQTKLENPEKYFNHSKIESIALDAIILKKKTIYAFVITGDRKIFRVKNFTQNIE